MNTIAFIICNQFWNHHVYRKGVRSHLLLSILVPLFTVGLATIAPAQDLQLGGSLSPSVFALPLEEPAVAFAGLRGLPFYRVTWGTA